MKQGARFSAVAQQFSQSATAAVGGDIGWVRPDQLAPELGKAVAQLKAGELSRADPDRRRLSTCCWCSTAAPAPARRRPAGADVYDIVQVVFPLPPQASEAARARRDRRGAERPRRRQGLPGAAARSARRRRRNCRARASCAAAQIVAGNAQHGQPGCGSARRRSRSCRRTASASSWSAANRRRAERRRRSSRDEVGEIADAPAARHAGAALSARPAAQRLCRCEGVTAT